MGLGQVLAAKGDFAGAAAAYREAVRLDPEDARVQIDLGRLLGWKGDRDGMLAAYREAIRLDPKNARAQMYLGLALAMRGDRDGALTAYREAIRLDPKNAEALLYLGQGLTGKGDFGGAVAAYQEAVQLSPNFDAAYDALARLLATGPDAVRDGKRAVEYATRACELTDWGLPTVLDTLAAAYAEAGDFDKAIEYEKRALAVPGLEHYGKAFSDGMAGRLALYAQKKPYHNPAYVRGEHTPPPESKAP